jgi:multicomponent Na+:H+ antiporter subunit B
MNSRWRTRIFFAAAIGFAWIYFLGVKNLPPWGDYRGLYGQMISAVSVYERHATDAVNAIDYDYRGFDTLGEEFILFASVLGAMLLLRRPERPETTTPPEKGLSDAVKVSAAVAFSVLVIFGIYISTHGQLTPGGGFQGGVILASASMLIYIAENFSVFKRITSHPAVEVLEALGAGFYAVIGLVPLVLAEPFLSNWLPLGTTGNVFSSETIAAISASVGVEVTAGFLLLGYTYLEDIIAKTGEEQNE